jgi:hypothetical protein
MSGGHDSAHVPVTTAHTERLLAAAAVLAGVAAWIFYLQEGLVLSHYDAKAHLVVSRRVIDSITPGWQQIGAVWLPLPHLIHLLPTQIDVLYRTGAFGSLVSIASFGVSAWAAARLVLTITGSRLGALTSTALMALNPNLLYLQATPMTEPLLLAVAFLVVLWTYEWLTTGPACSGVATPVPARLGWALVAAVWTRYEAWPIVGAVLAAACYSLWRTGVPFPLVARRVARLALWPAAAVLVFLINSRVTVGSWFVSGGFYVPDPTYQQQLARTAIAIWWGTHQLSGYVVEIVALSAGAMLATRAMTRRADAALLVPVGLFASAALPFYAFYEGHPFRIRYMVPLVGTCAVFGGLAVGLTSWRISRGEQAKSGAGAALTHERRARAAAHRPALPDRRDRRRGGYGPALATVILVASSVIESPPWEERAPLLAEAEWDVPLSVGRREVTTCLAAGYRGEKVLASMASLAHYMQELSREGFGIADFVHEGNGAIWELALETGPAPHTGWMLVEEQAEGGDVLTGRLRRDPGFARGMTRICAGGGVALYKRH